MYLCHGQGHLYFKKESSCKCQTSVYFVTEAQNICNIEGREWKPMKSLIKHDNVRHYCNLIYVKYTSLKHVPFSFIRSTWQKQIQHQSHQESRASIALATA